MTREEVKQLIFLINTAYPNFGFNKLQIEEQRDMVSNWLVFLEDENVAEIGIGLKNYVKNSGKSFAPTISDLIEYAHMVNQLAAPSEAEAWDIVRKAIGKSGYTYRAEEEFKKMPLPVQKAIGSPNYLVQMARNEYFSESKEKESFIWSYKQVLERQQKEDRLPIEAKEELAKLRQLQQDTIAKLEVNKHEEENVYLLL